MGLLRDRVAARPADKQGGGQQQAQPQPDQEAPPPAAAPASAASAEAPEDQTTQLQHLADMHDQGILTDEEFTSAKAKVLGI